MVFSEIYWSYAGRIIVVHGKNPNAILGTCFPSPIETASKNIFILIIYNL